MVAGAAAIGVTVGSPQSAIASHAPGAGGGGASVADGDSGRRARRLVGDVGRARRGPGADSLRAPAARRSHHPVRVGNADARRGRRHRDARAPPVAARARRVRRGLPRPLARRQAPALPGPRGRRARVRVPVAASRRARRRARRADRRAVDGVRADLARRRRDVLVRHRREAHGRLLGRRRGG